MKKMSIVAVIAALALGLAACGGSDSGSSTGGTTGTTTNAQAMGTSSKVLTGSMQLVQPLFAAIAGAPAAQVIKSSTGPTVTCTETGANQFTCNMTDEFGGTASCTGTADPTAYSFDFNCTFNNFKPDSSTTVDGAFEWKVSYNAAGFGGASAMVAKQYASTGKSSADECNYTEDDIDGTTYCQETTEACTESSATHMMHFSIVIGPNGLTYTDICGTFTYGPNATMTMDWCSANIQSAVVLFTASINGTFNGTSINESANISCDFSSVSGM